VLEQHEDLQAAAGQRLYAVVAITIAIAACGHASAPVAAPTTIAIAKPNGLAWDAAHGALWIADESTYSLVRWPAHEARVVVAAPVDKDGLGGVAIAPNGQVIVARFGGGSAGGVSRDGTPIPGLDPTRRRLGVAIASDGALIDAWFVKGKDVAKAAGLERIDSSGAVSDLVTGLDKPVGVAITGDALWWSDQGAGTLSRCALPACHDAGVVAHLDGPDLLAAAPGGGVLVANGHDLDQIDPDGTITPIAHDLDRPRGIAVDAAGRRLFVADRAVVRIIPLPSARPRQPRA
jgi:sugar lactone lactonase YvrE